MKKSCFENLNNRTCNSLFVTISTISFQNTLTISTELSDFHKTVTTVLKMKYKRNLPIEI